MLDAFCRFAHDSAEPDVLRDLNALIHRDIDQSLFGCPKMARRAFGGERCFLGLLLCCFHDVCFIQV